MKVPTDDNLRNMRSLFLKEDWDSGEFLDWFGEFGLALIEEVLRLRATGDEHGRQTRPMEPDAVCHHQHD